MNEEEEFEFRLRLEKERAQAPAVGDAPSSVAAVDAAFGKPVKEPKGAIERVTDAAFRGSLMGGPIPGLVSAGIEASDIGGELLQKGAYEAGGAVTDLTGSPKAGFATNVGIQAIPSLLGMGAKTPSALEAPARRIMQSAAMPERATRMSGEAERAIGRMLEKDINATRGGMESQQALASKLEETIQGILSKSQGTIDPENVAIKTLKESLAKIKFNMDPVADAKIIEDSLNTFLAHPQIAGLGRVSVETANRLKQGIYAELRAAKRNIYGQGLGKQSTEIMADKDRAAQLRQAVGEAEPAVVPSLAEQAEALNVVKTLKPQVSREGNKMLIGIGTVSPTIERTIVWMLDRYPWFKSFMARGMYTAGKHPASAAITAGQATQGQQ